MKVTDMSTVTVHNFSYYAFNPTATSLSKQDQRIAIIATALLALTLGIGHLVCAIIYAVLKKNFEAGIAIPANFRAIENTFENTFIPETTQRSRPIIRNNGSNYSFSANEREIRNFERDARRIQDPLVRTGAFIAADIGRGMNQIGQGLADWGII